MRERALKSDLELHDSAAEIPIPRKPDSKNKITTATTQTSGEINTVRARLREARAGAASGQRYPSPAVLTASQTPPLPVGCSQPLCSAEGTGHRAGELHHGSAAAWAAEEEVHALDPTALRAEALLGGRGGSKWAFSEEGVCTGGDDMHIAEFSLLCFCLHFLSYPEHIPAVWSFPSWKVFPCARSFPVSMHRPCPNLGALIMAL